MVTDNIFYRTYKIIYNDKSGTAFTIDIDRKQYLVTAYHVIEGIKNQDTISIGKKQESERFDTQLVGQNLDVAVLALPKQLSKTLPLAPATQVELGQDIYFLGYPYGFNLEITEDLNNSFLISFVKKGIISSLIYENKQVKHLYLDGYGNHGFSGGPVYFYSKDKKLAKHERYCVAGVISQCFDEIKHIFNQDKETKLTYKYNTGIIKAVGIDIAVEIIKANPIGYPL